MCVVQAEAQTATIYKFVDAGENPMQRNSMLAYIRRVYPTLLVKIATEEITREAYFAMISRDEETLH